MNTKTMIQLDLPANHKHLNILDVCITELLEQIERLSEPGITINDIRLAVQEAWNNIIDHAYADKLDGRVHVSLMLDEYAHHIIIELQDTGASFDFDTVNVSDIDPTTAHDKDLGLFLLYTLMDEVTYVPRPGNNFWRLMKHLA